MTFPHTDGSTETVQGQNDPGPVPEPQQIVFHTNADAIRRIKAGTQHFLLAPLDPEDGFTHDRLEQISSAFQSPGGLQFGLYAYLGATSPELIVDVTRIIDGAELDHAMQTERFDGWWLFDVSVTVGW